MTVEHIPSQEDSTLSHQVIDSASDLLSNAIDGSSNVEGALERANENFENHGFELVKKNHEDAEAQAHDRHNQEHSWAIVTDRILEADVLPPLIPLEAKLRMIGRLLAYDARVSDKLKDFREQEEKPLEHYRKLLRTMARNKH